MRHLIRFALTVGIALALVSLPARTSGAAGTNPLNITLCGRADADLVKVLRESGYACPRYATAAEAVHEARPAAGVVVLADGYPGERTKVTAEVFEAARAKGVRLYVEYPESVPGLELGTPQKPQWQRVVVATDHFGEALPKLRIMMVSECQFTPTKTAEPWLVAARVAGFDRAVFGLPKDQSPILFDLPDRKLVIATTRLSSFITGRYAPADEWKTLWDRLLTHLAGETVTLECEPLVRPAYGPKAPLPADAERRAVAGFAKWIIDAKLLVTPAREPAIHKLLAGNADVTTMPTADEPGGDGSRGVLEGFNSEIRADGSQLPRVPLRCDCIGETAMCMALDAAVNANTGNRRIAENLLEYIYVTSDAQRGVRGDPKHPAFGHVAWGVVAPDWEKAGYGDDNGRLMLATAVAGAVLKTDRWDEPLLRCLLANLRTTGTKGFRGERIDIVPLEQYGWRHWGDAPTIFYSPHYEAALWACNLWAYARTGYKPFLEKARTAIGMTMAVYPEKKWLWGNNLERARMLLALAWLVRVEDTPEHRAWLRRMCDDVLQYQDACGAIAEVPNTARRSAHGCSPTSNEEYGTREMPIVQDEGDQACDQLYVSGFVLSALHETNAVLKDAKVKDAEDRLARFLCRIQVRSEAVPYVNGGWFRAFDYGRWEFWASSGDAGWGAWSLEAGWAQAWGAATMALREMNTTVWDLTADSRIGRHMEAVQKLMAVNDGGPFKK